MFYATQIKSVGNGQAVDVHGRTLSFIGYLPVKPGDTVFTDGKVIFGNVKPKGSVLLDDVPSGIPVLSDDLCGYFDKRGKFKAYKIAGDDWIVNDKKIYAHDGDNIIDAEISADGSVLTVEKKVEDIGQAPDNDTFDELYTATGGFFSGSIFKDSDICSDDNALSRNLILIVRLDNQPIQEIDVYSQYLKDYEEAVLKGTILRRHSTGEEETIAIEEDLLKTWNSQLLERHSGLRAQLVNFKILSDEKWKLLITFQAVARWELYHRYTGRQFHACHTLFNFVEFSSDDLSDKKFNSLFLTYRRPRAYDTDVLEILGKKFAKLLSLFLFKTVPLLK